jgi:hypothetical protein
MGIGEGKNYKVGAVFQNDKQGSFSAFKPRFATVRRESVNSTLAESHPQNRQAETVTISTGGKATNPGMVIREGLVAQVSESLASGWLGNFVNGGWQKCAGY